MKHDIYWLRNQADALREGIIEQRRNVEALTHNERGVSWCVGWPFYMLYQFKFAKSNNSSLAIIPHRLSHELKLLVIINWLKAVDKKNQQNYHKIWEVYKQLDVNSEHFNIMHILRWKSYQVAVNWLDSNVYIISTWKWKMLSTLLAFGSNCVDVVTFTELKHNAFFFQYTPAL